MSLVGESLPDTFPIFPLPGALLLPAGNLPLNIFEPRYLAMVRDALRTHRIIGMIQPRAAEATGTTAPDLYGVGCAGRITNFSETEDGRILITLTGIARFDVAEELTVTTPYRQVVGRFDRWRHDCAVENPPEGLKDDLLRVVADYFDLQGIEADWRAVKEAPLVPLVVSLAMICPFGVAEKQGLLEAATVADQARLLIALMEMEVHHQAGTESEVRH